MNSVSRADTNMYAAIGKPVTSATRPGPVPTYRLVTSTAAEEQDKRGACPRQRREQNTQRKRRRHRAEFDEITRNGASRPKSGLIAHRQSGARSTRQGARNRVSPFARASSRPTAVVSGRKRGRGRKVRSFLRFQLPRFMNRT